MEKSWRPKRNANVDAAALELSRVESFVLARVDGTLTAEDLVDMTGLSNDDVSHALTSLASRGAIENASETPSEPDAPPPASAWVVAAIETMARSSSLPPSQRPPSVRPLSSSVPPSQSPPAPSQPPSPEEIAAAHEASTEDATTDEDSRNHRKIYETRFHPLPRDQRIEAARHETGGNLLALCFDPEPAVVRAVLENHEAGLAHARLIALHHRNPVGIDMLASRNDFVRDAQVHRYLLRNPQLPEARLSRLLTSKRLVDVYKATSDRDIPDSTRVRARHLLRARFAVSQAEERVELVWTTEGRCLASLVGCTFDSRTTALICAKTFTSTILVQNLARFSATPPLLLAHMLKQAFVRRQMHLKQLILQHPNTPGDAKRNA